MSKEGNDDKRYHEAEQLGRNNKNLISSVQGWCQHIDVKGRLGSMMGQMLNIPMSTSIGCPHTDDGYQAANLEWIARDFIIKNCLNCPKHKPLNADNFGVKVIADYTAYKQKLEAEQLAKSERLAALREEAETLVKNERTKADVKKLSILKLVEKLGIPETINETTAQILESARLSPDFFSDAAIDYLSLFFDLEKFGKTLVDTAASLQNSGHKLSPFTLNNVLAAIENEDLADTATSIWAADIPDDQLPNHPAVIKRIIQNCSYQNFYHFNADRAGSYPGTISLLQRIYHTNNAYFNSLIQDLLAVQSKPERVNVNGLLRDLIADQTIDITAHLPLLIRSFNYEDDTYGGDSADRETLLTIIELYRFAPKLVMDVAEKESKQLSEWGSVELFKLYQKILTEDDLYIIDDDMSLKAVAQLNFYLMGNLNKAKLVEGAMDAIEQVVSERPEILIPHLDAYIGIMMQINEKRQKFEWYRADASDTSKPAATFNPLAGKNFWEMENEATEIARLFHTAGGIVSNLIAKHPEGRTKSFVEVIEKIDSKTDGKFKAELIGVLQSSVKDFVSLSDILPQIYSYLHDIDSEDVRFAGMKFIVYLIEKYPQLITNTLIELIKVFLKDPLIGVRGLAVEVYGKIIQQFPEHADKVLFKHIQSLMFDKYVFVHKAAVSFSYNVYPFLTKNERTIWNLDLYRLADFYLKSEDPKYTLEITRAVLFYSADNPTVHKNVVKNLLLRICNCKDYYTEKDALKLLTYLTKKNADYKDEWVREAISFLAKTLPREPIGNNDDRDEFLDFFYNLDEATIIRHKDLIINHVKTSIDNLKNPIMPDIVHFYGVFAFFNHWIYAKELAEYFDEKVPHDSKFDYVHKFNKRGKRMAETEVNVSTEQIDLNYLYSLTDAQS